MRIGCVSDVCLGYGSPQIGYLVESLADHYEAEALVVEPRVPGVAPKHTSFPSFQIRRSRTAFQPYSAEGRIEYAIDAARMVNEWEPDLLIICCTFTLPVLFKLRKRPHFVIYYSYESIPHYGDFDITMNRQLDGLVDLVIFPEENRAELELGRSRFGGARTVILYNCPAHHSRRPAVKGERNGRFFYAGTIDPVETLAAHFLDSRISGFPIDLYGPLRGEWEAEPAKVREGLQGQVRYWGVLESRELGELRRRYLYSLIMWNPKTENQLYAAPNKLFEAIADGVPPLAAPHPQCKKILDRYGCGTLLSDWSVEALAAGLNRAAREFLTDKWNAMVTGCETAFASELNWELQFEKLKVHLK